MALRESVASPFSHFQRIHEFQQVWDLGWRTSDSYFENQKLEEVVIQIFGESCQIHALQSMQSFNKPGSVAGPPRRRREGGWLAGCWFEFPRVLPDIMLITSNKLTCDPVLTAGGAWKENKQTTTMIAVQQCLHRSLTGKCVEHSVIVACFGSVSRQLGPAHPAHHDSPRWPPCWSAATRQPIDRSPPRELIVLINTPPRCSNLKFLIPPCQVCRTPRILPHTLLMHPLPHSNSP